MSQQQILDVNFLIFLISLSICNSSFKHKIIIEIFLLNFIELFLEFLVL